MSEETTEALTTTTDTEPVEGLEDFDPSDLIIPRLKLVQPSSAEGTPGALLSNLSGEEYDSLRFVPLSIRKGRVLWEEGNDMPICRSSDALRPDEGIESPQNSVCAERRKGRTVDVCSMGKWGDGPPPCKLNYTILGLDIDHDEQPFMITLSGTSIKPTKKLISTFTLRRKSIYSMSVVLSTQKGRSKHGSFYVVSFSGYQDCNPPDLYRERYIELKDFDPAAADAASAEQTTADAADGDGDDLPF